MRIKNANYAIEIDQGLQSIKKERLESQLEKCKESRQKFREVYNRIRSELDKKSK